jgi:hypothetical protein
MLMSKVWEMEKAKREFLRSIFFIIYLLLFFLLARWSHYLTHQGLLY